MFGVDTFTTPKLEAPLVYGVTYLYDRPSEGLAVGDAALHLYPTEYLRFELSPELGSDNYRADNATGDTPWNYLGGRPTLIFDVGWFKLRLGRRVPETLGDHADPRPRRGAEERPGPGARAEGRGRVDPVRDRSRLRVRCERGIGKQEDVDAFARPVLENSFTTKSFGGFANLRFTDHW
jgi:hypothetical protein